MLPSFDKWGHASMGRFGLSRRATTRILTTHLSGATPIRAPREVRFYDDGWAEAVEEVVEALAVGESNGDATETVAPPELSSEEIAARYEAGLAARRGTAEATADLQPAFDDLDDRTDELLARIQSLLETVGED